MNSSNSGSFSNTVHSSSSSSESTDAQVIWKTYRERFSNIASAPIYRSPQSYSARTLLPIESENFLRKRSAKIIQKQWLNLRSDSNKFVAARTGKKRSALLAYFLNLDSHKKIVQKSLHKQKLIELFNAIETADYKREILKDSILPQLLLTLALNEKITVEQFFTLLQFNQVQNYDKYYVINSFQILNANLAFSEQFNFYILPKLINQFPGLDAHSLKLFALLINQLPKSEQYFHIALRTGSSRLQQLLIRIGAIWSMGDMLIMCLSTGIQNAMGIMNSGIFQYAPTILRLGKQSIDDIEYGVRFNFRPAAIAYPNLRYKARVHGHLNYSYFVSTQHDYHHATVRSSIPRNLHLALERMVDLTRFITGFKWSREIWDWIDCDFRYGIQYSSRTIMSLPPQAMTEFFCHLLLNGTNSRHTIYTCGGYLVVPVYAVNALNEACSTFINQYALTPVGVGILVNMIKYPQEWESLGVIGKYLIDPYLDYYNKISRSLVMKNTKNISEKVTLFLLLCELTLINQVSEDELKLFVTEAASKINDLEKLLSFKKNEFIDAPLDLASPISPDQSNCIALYLGSEKVTDSIIHQFYRSISIIAVSKKVIDTANSLSLASGGNYCPGLFKRKKSVETQVELLKNNDYKKLKIK